MMTVDNFSELKTSRFLLKKKNHDENGRLHSHYRLYHEVRKLQNVEISGFLGET